MFALKSRDKTNRSIKTSILYCSNETIKNKELDMKPICVCALCSCVSVVVLLLYFLFASFRLSQWCGFFDGDSAAASDFFSVFPHPLGKNKTKQTEEYCSFHTISGSVCLVQ